MANSETNNSQIINSVPGVESRQSAGSVHFGDIVHIPEEEFRGNPTRVIGHPSNPNSEVIQSYADELNGSDVQERAAAEISKAAGVSVELIDVNSVPK